MLQFNTRYDRIKLMPKEIKNVQFIACMNPSAGTFTIGIHPFNAT